MFQRMIDYSNENPTIIAFVMCAVGIAALILILVSNEQIKHLKRTAQRLKCQIKLKKIDSSKKDAEIRNLKAQLFAVQMDGKIMERKLRLEIEARDIRIANLENGNKQLAKWGTVK